MPDESINSALAKLSKEPGVYLFFDRSDRVIYIGKAINLKGRVRSYWNESCWGERPKLKHMVPKIKRFETIITKSEKEALILESNLVFKHQPKYNVLLKDNKSFPWLVITYDDIYPRLIPIRNIEKLKSNKNTKNKFFGPYTNVAAMYENLNLVHELFPLRRKRIPPFRDRPCLNYDLGKCLGPCQKLVSQEDYMNMIRQVEMLLKGDHLDLRDLLEAEMRTASDNLEYEQAAKIRDRLKALETFNEKQNVIFEDTNLNQDIFTLILDTNLTERLRNAKRSGSKHPTQTQSEKGFEDIACLQIFKIRAGKLINRETTELEFNPDEDEYNLFEEAFVQYYAQIPDSELPDEISLSHKLSEESSELFANWLSERRTAKHTTSNSPEYRSSDAPEQVNKQGKNLKKQVKLFTPKQGEKYAQVELAKRNGKVIIERLKLERLEDASKNINKALTNLQRELDLRTEPSHIECFDISHIQGTDTVASMVCFIDGMPAKDQYRKFKISRDQNDDFASMREVITRRYSPRKSKQNIHRYSPDKTVLSHNYSEDKHTFNLNDNTEEQAEYQDRSLPNLIIIDGGKGQLSSACEVLRDLGLGHIATIGLAKKEEEVYLPGETKAILLDRKSPELFLIQRIRNEAHRFAITYHRKLRSKRSTLSVLDGVQGLGPTKKKALIKAFGSLEKIKKASLEELTKVKGITEFIAGKVKEKIK